MLPNKRSFMSSGKQVPCIKLPGVRTPKFELKTMDSCSNFELNISVYLNNFRVS